MCASFDYLCFAGNSRREPEEPEDATKGRDVFNEKPPPEELLAVSDLGKAVTTALPDNVVMYLVSYSTCIFYPLRNYNFVVSKCQIFIFEVFAYS